VPAPPAVPTCKPVFGLFAMASLDAGQAVSPSELAAPRLQHGEPGSVRPSPSLREERGLADTGWPLDHERAPFGTPRGSNRSVQCGELLCPSRSGCSGARQRRAIVSASCIPITSTPGPATHANPLDQRLLRPIVRLSLQVRAPSETDDTVGSCPSSERAILEGRVRGPAEAAFDEGGAASSVSSPRVLRLVRLGAEAAHTSGVSSRPSFTPPPPRRG
jgi:hypothetical protein